MLKIFRFEYYKIDYTYLFIMKSNFKQDFLVQKFNELFVLMFI